MAAVEFRNVNIEFGAAQVVKDLNLRVEDGEFVVLVGPSGCGKSTILRSVAGLVGIASGDLLSDGARMNDKEPANRDVAMVFQSYALYPHMTVYKNLSFGLRIRKEPTAEIDRKVREVAELVGLTAHLQKRPAAMSGGQRQRVALARAILRHPGVFLFDEPLSNLDAEFRSSMRSELVRFHRRLKTSMIYVTHDQTEAMTMGDRIAVLAPLTEGRQTNLMQYATPDEIYHRPANLFVARFIGSPRMNVFTCKVEKGQAVFGTQRIDLPPAARGLAKVALGQRPEHLHIIEGDAAAGVTGTLEHFENLGHEYIGQLASDAGPITLRRAETISVAQIGATFGVMLDPGRLHFFDPATELRINQP
ncbi:MAG: ABC transporter ATP-binding protein [Paracoccaceae bacterium]